MAGYRVKYVLATKLVNDLVEAVAEKQLPKTIARYGRVELVFQVLTEREEKNSMATTSDESLGGWTRTFAAPRFCAAIVGRLTFNGTII
ncbi:ATP-binding protein [Streptomyces gardneri]|nr:ATP-binding protein [Streptomyces gardneri]CUM43986.1 Mobile element protein [Streptomyces venezuelae]